MGGVGVLRDEKSRNYKNNLYPSSHTSILIDSQKIQLKSLENETYPVRTI